MAANGVESDGEIISFLEEEVWNIRLNRPGKKNALTMAMFSQFAGALSSADSNEKAKSIVVAGAGDSFTAGHDLKGFEQWPQSPSDPVPKFLHTLAHVKKPLVIAVHGAAVGIGVTLLLHADWVCCTPDAKLRLPFIDLGIVPEAGSTLLLTQTVGLMRARRLLLTGEVFYGNEAYNWGLVSENVNEPDLVPTALNRAKILGNKPGASFAQIKAWLRPGDNELAERIDSEISFINKSAKRRRAES